MKKTKRVHRFETVWQDLLIIVIGVVLLFIPAKFAPDSLLGLAFLYSGFIVSAFGLAELAVVMYWQNPNRLKQLKQWHKQRMKQANQGVVWVWVVCLAGICMYAIAFYVLLYPTLQIIGIVEGMITWDADAAFTLNLAKTVLNWHPIMFIVGLLLWAFVNSQRREDVTYPVY